MSYQFPVASYRFPVSKNRPVAAGHQVHHLGYSDLQLETNGNWELGTGNWELGTGNERPAT